MEVPVFVRRAVNSESSTWTWSDAAAPDSVAFSYVFFTQRRGTLDDDEGDKNIERTAWALVPRCGSILPETCQGPEGTSGPLMNE